MADEVSERIHEWLPADLTGRDEIRGAIRDSGWSQKWGPETLNRVVDRVDRRRTVETPEVMRRTRRRHDAMPSGGPERKAVVRASDGTILGEPENVTTWEDRWGNVMGRNQKTGTTKKVDPADE